MVAEDSLTPNPSPIRWERGTACGRSRKNADGFLADDHAHFSPTLARRDDAASARGAGDSGFSVGLRETLAGHERGGGGGLQCAAGRNRRRKFNHGVSNLVADGASRDGGGDS